jgi:hypothetical protein
MDHKETTIWIDQINDLRDPTALATPDDDHLVSLTPCLAVAGTADDRFGFVWQDPVLEDLTDVPLDPAEVFLAGVFKY